MSVARARDSLRKRVKSIVATTSGSGARKGSLAREKSGARLASGGQLRIIGGQFRGRRLPILNQSGLRPTGDRTRETLFNWLSPILTGSRCLDCFAGAGGLGFEAASRGASKVAMIERGSAAARQLQHNAALLKADTVSVIMADAARWLADQPVQPFDIVFLDPPFTLGLLATACGLLQQRGWVAVGSVIYLEADARDGFPPLPTGWTLTRDKRAGQVRYGLVEVRGDSEEALGG